MDNIQNLYERFKKGEKFAKPFSQKQLGQLSAKDPSELASNNKVVQDMLKKYSHQFQNKRNLIWDNYTKRLLARTLLQVNKGVFL